MNFLITGFVTLIGAIITFFGRKFTVITASIAAFVVLTSALVVAIQSLMTSILAVTFMPVWIAYGIGLFLPANFSLVLGAIISAKAVRAAYDIAIAKVHLVNSAN